MTYTATYSEKGVMPQMGRMAEFYSSAPLRTTKCDLSQFDIYALAQNEPIRDATPRNRIEHENYALISAREAQKPVYDFASLDDPKNIQTIRNHYNSREVRAVIINHKGRFGYRKKGLVGRIASALNIL